MGEKVFHCANNECDIYTAQPIELCSQELDGYMLCNDCFKRGYRLERGIVVRKIRTVSISQNKIDCDVIVRQ